MIVVLYQPQIPQNAGNIVRTCAVTGCQLVMVEPLGFSIADRWLKRAGLDYWEGVEVTIIDDLEEFLSSRSDNFYFFSSKALQSYDSVEYQSDDILIFGSETSGLAPSCEKKWPDKFITIPMREDVRCLNLATSVGIAVYEAWRQRGFN